MKLVNFELKKKIKVTKLAFKQSTGLQTEQNARFFLYYL